MSEKKYFVRINCCTRSVYVTVNDLSVKSYSLVDESVWKEMAMMTSSALAVQFPSALKDPPFVFVTGSTSAPPTRSAVNS